MGLLLIFISLMKTGEMGLAIVTSVKVVNKICACVQNGAGTVVRQLTKMWEKAETVCVIGAMICVQNTTAYLLE